MNIINSSVILERKISALDKKITELEKKNYPNIINILYGHIFIVIPFIYDIIYTSVIINRGKPAIDIKEEVSRNIQFVIDKLNNK